MLKLAWHHAHYGQCYTLILGLYNICNLSLKGHSVVLEKKIKLFCS